jgi:hypothetical protein
MKTTIVKIIATADEGSKGQEGEMPVTCETEAAMELVVTG